ncbi:MAG: hypothetical protein MZV63_09805, partial [Marinilabiliales bacterium]|nr:hypothetical protein [Marinilabiliales bacterium]
SYVLLRLTPVTGTQDSSNLDSFCLAFFTNCIEIIAIKLKSIKASVSTSTHKRLNKILCFLLQHELQCRHPTRPLSVAAIPAESGRACP